MARSKNAEKKAKAAYTRRYRKENPEKVLAYNRKTVKERASRNKARAKVAKKVGKSKLKGKEIDHKDGNPRNNASSNLRIKKKGHGGGKKGNQNARKTKKRSRNLYQSRRK